MTKSNKVRLRYVAFCSVAVAALLTNALGVNLSVPHFFAVSRDAAMQVADAGDTGQQPADAGTQTTFQSQISEGIRKASAAIQKSARPLQRTLTIGQGDTIAGVLQSGGVSGPDAAAIVSALGDHYDPRKAQAGQVLHVNFKPGAGDELEFAAMTMKLSPVQEIVVKKQKDESFAASLEEKKLVEHAYARTAEIQTSLYGSAAQAGIPQQVIAEMIRIYSWNIDFQRDIRQGDTIEVMYDTYETEDGEVAKYGDVLYANLSVGGKSVPIYRYETKDGRVDYFEPDGHSIRKALMKTPIDGARISSGFGMRKHPILGYTKMHKGIDFAAPTGTPIYAAGDGIVEFAGRKNGYGNFVMLRHNSGLKTGYGHMHNIAKGIANGKRVAQGDVIGYVGSTGRSTGPHLHYEVVVNSKQVNPNSINLPTGEQLAGKELDKFKSLMTTIRQQYVSLTSGLKFAQRDEPEAKDHLIR